MALKVPALYMDSKVMLYGAGAGVSGAVCADTKLASQRATDSCAVAAAALPTAAVSGMYNMQQLIHFASGSVVA
jgi:hypothetical protein